MCGTYSFMSYCLGVFRWCFMQLALFRLHNPVINGFSPAIQPSLSNLSSAVAGPGCFTLWLGDFVTSGVRQMCVAWLKCGASRTERGKETEWDKKLVLCQLRPLLSKFIYVMARWKSGLWGAASDIANCHINCRLSCSLHPPHTHTHTVLGNLLMSFASLQPRQSGVWAMLQQFDTHWLDGSS